MADLINSIIDIDVISKEVETTLSQLSSINKRMEELSKKAIVLHFEVKKDESMSALLAHMKEYGKMVSEIGQKEKEQAAASAKLAEAESKLVSSANATKQIIFVQDKQKKSIEELSAAMDNAADTYRHWVDGAGAIKSELASNSAALSKAKEDVKDFSKRLSEMRSKASWSPISPESLKELEEKLGNASARVESYTKAVKENRQELKLAEVVENGIAGSYEVRSAMMGRLLATAKTMGNETEEEKRHQEELAIAINTLNDSLKESDEAWGNNQRKVGTYENATKGLRGIITDITNQMAALSLAGKSNSEEYRNLSSKASEYNNALRNVQKETKGLASNTASMDALRNSLQSLNVAFMLLKSAGGLTEEGKLLANVMEKLYAATEIYNLTSKSSIVISKVRQLQSLALAKSVQLEAAATGKATIAQRIFNAVAKANPYVILAMALVSVVGALVLFSSRTSDAKKRQKEFNEELKETIKSVTEHGAKINTYINTLNNVNSSTRQQQEAFKGLNKELDGTGLKFNTLQEAQEWFIKNGDKYTNMLKQQAFMQANLNKYTDASAEKRQLENKTGDLTSKEKKRLKELGEILKESEAGIQLWSALYYASMSELGLKSKDETANMQKIYDLRIAAMKDGQSKELAALKNAQSKEEKEVIGSVEEIAEQKKLIEQKYAIEREKINKKYREAAVNIERQLEGLRIAAIKDGYNKELLILIENEKKEKDAILNNAQLTTKQKGKLVKGITDKYEKEYEDLEKQYAKNRVQLEIETLNMIAEASKDGTERRLSAQVSSLEKQRILEKAEAEKKGKELMASNEVIQANLAAIDAKYDKQRLDSFEDFINKKIEKAQEELEGRAHVAQEAAIAEEAVLLAQYKNREINEEKYNKGVADIRHKYAVQGINDEIDELEKLLTTSDLTAEQRRDINNKLYDAKKALSDEETSHEIANIKKVEENRKKAADMAKDLAKQAFNMTMDFLTQQSEAKIEEFDAELSRIDEWKEKELERLDESVMSDETRAAETKRINAQAKADSDKIEAEKRKEEQKKAIYQKAQSVVQAIMNTAQGISAALTLPGPVGIAFAAIVGAMGAAQIAMISAQQLPKYAKGIYGDESHPGGYAIVGDARKREYALTTSGKLYETPAVPTLVDMEKGTQVFPDYKTMMQYFRPEIPKYTTNTTAPDLSGGIDRLERAIKNVKSTQQVQMNLDNNGIWYVANNKSGRRRHINAFIHGNA